jgi:CHAD domain-containing protein
MKSYLGDKITTHLTSVEQHLNFFKKDKDPEHLHRLRVEIKKTNALFSFAEKTYKQKFKHKKLKAIFHNAGQIRELLIHIKLLNELDHLPERFTTRLKKNQKDLENIFIKNIPRYTDKVNNFRTETNLPKDLPAMSTIKKFFVKEVNKAHKKIPNKNRDDMHRFRMKIKKLMYAYKALPKNLQTEIKLDPVYIDKLQKKAGDWHDTYSALDFLSHEPSADQLTDHISKLRKKEKQQFKVLYKFTKD